MTERRWDPQRLDVQAFARAEGHLAGETPLAEMPRLMEGALPLEQAPEAARPVRWSLAGWQRPIPGGGEAIWCQLKAEATVWMTCQRCLEPMAVALTVDRPMRFARDEAEAEALDEELDEDVVVLRPRIRLDALIEDELILALPIVPRHEACPDGRTAETVAVAGEGDGDDADDFEHWEPDGAPPARGPGTAKGPDPGASPAAPRRPFEALAALKGGGAGDAAKAENGVQAGSEQGAPAQPGSPSARSPKKPSRH